MSGLLKFGVKVGVFGGAIYYTHQIGVWDDSTKTYKIAQEVINYAEPYVKSALNELHTQYPAVQELPTIADMNRSAVTCWNKGVIKSVDFTANLPCMMKKYVSEGISYVVNELRKENNLKSNRNTENGS